MALIIRRLWENYKYVEQEYSHPQTQSWPLVSSPVPIFTILAAYLYFCTKLGPRLMRDRKPFDLRNVLIIYNAVQVVFSVVLFYQGGVYGYFTYYSFSCQPIDYSNDPRDIKVAELVWWYYMSKISELLDTVFFVLRKKNRQVSALHLYHHSIMLLAAYFSTKFAPGGHGAFVGWINTFVHIIMYSYYFVSGLGPQYQKYLWWKKHLTILQLFQFVMIFYHNFSVLFRECAYPRLFNGLLIIESLIFIYMFGDFYYKSYVKSSSRRKEEEKTAEKIKGI